MLKNTNSFKEVMSQYGLNPPEIIEPGNFYRFPGINKPVGNSAGWCKLFNDMRGGVFGDFSSGLSATWFADKRKRFMSIYNKQNIAVNQRKQHANAAKKAERILLSTSPACSSHPYLRKKQVQPHMLRQYQSQLVIPIIDTFGNITSLQFINNDGSKRLLKEGKKRSGYHKIGEVTPIIYICEGWATGASIYEATGNCVIVAIDAGNMPKVAELIQAKYLHSHFFVCADNDNAGLEYSLKATKYIYPKFEPIIPYFNEALSHDSKMDFSDFNDLHRVAGLIEVKKQIQNQIEVQKMKIKGLST